MIKAPRFTAAAALAAVALSLTACGSNLAAGTDNGAQATGSKGPIIIGVLVDQTSYLKTLDQGVLKGINSAVKSINAKGGIGGRQVEIVSGDMAADPQKEVQEFQRVSSQNKPVLFLNGFSSAGNAATAPLATSQKTPMIVASVIPAQNNQWMYSTITPMKYETGTRVEYLQSKGIKKVGILHDPTPYNKLQLDVISAQLKAAGIEITGSEEHASDAVDLRSQTAKLLAGGPEAIIKLSSGPTQIVAAKALKDAGSQVPLILGIESRANIVQATDSYPNVLVVASPLQVNSALPQGDRSEAVKTFIAANTSETDPTYVGRGWDAMQVAATAIDKAGSTDGQVLRDALESLPAYDGTSGAYDYTPTDHYGITQNPDYLAKITESAVEIVFTPKK